MSTELAKRPGSVMRSLTQQVRDHAAAMERLRDQYTAALKRAEAQYFDGVKRLMDAMAQDTQPPVADDPNETVPPPAS